MGAAAVIGGIGLGAAVTGQVIGGLSKMSQKAREAQAVYSAAKEETIAAEFQIQQSREYAGLVKGAQQAGYGRSGVLVSEGTPLRNMVRTVQKQREDEFWIRQNLKQRVKQLKYRGAQAIGQKTAYGVQTGLGATGSLLSGLAGLP